MLNNILTIDPSGTGKTGIYYQSVNGVIFKEFKSLNWQEHLKFLVDFLKGNPVDIIVYEYTNYLKSNKKREIIAKNDIVNLFRLMGAIEGLKYAFPNIKVASIDVKAVKSLYDKLLSKEKFLINLNYKVGSGGGWLFTLPNGEIQRLSLHMLDAYLLYQIWNKRNKKY